MVTKFLQRTPSLHQEHYEQFGVTDGFLKLRPQSKVVVGEQSIHACGMRDRAWGIRDWAYLSIRTMYLWALIRKVVSFGTSTLASLLCQR